MDLSEADILKVFEDSDEDDSLVKIDGKNVFDKQFDQVSIKDNYGIFHDHDQAGQFQR